MIFMDMKNPTSGMVWHGYGTYVAESGSGSADVGVSQKICKGGCVEREYACPCCLRTGCSFVSVSAYAERSVESHENPAPESRGGCQGMSAA